MFQAVLFIRLANQRFSGLPDAQATSFSQIDAEDSYPSNPTDLPENGPGPSASSGDLAFNWHDVNNSGNNNTVETIIWELTDGGNKSLAGNSAGQYVIEALAVQFNTTHFKENASSTPWIAVFPCAATSPAGNASDLVSNAHKMFWASIPFHRGTVGSQTSPRLRKIVSPQAESFVAESFFPMGLVDPLFLFITHLEHYG
ncbi:hypothetical protein B0H13DRAFT_2546210 [Mycena leptocephala]|nr:hypothetical protein B0H13DRAFT_2546210 [Mycena leptocephala]